MLVLLVALSLTMAPHLVRTPLWLAGVCVLILGWRLLYECKLVALPTSWLRLLFTFLLVFGIFFSYHSIVGRQAGTALVLALLGMKLLETQSQRDVMVTLLFGYFVVVINFLFSQSIFAGVYMLITVLLLTTAMIAVNHKQGGFSYQGMHLRLAFKMLLQSLPMAIILFILFPRIPGPLWGLPQDAFSAQTGLSDTMSPGNINQLSQSDAVAFRVQFHDAPPQQSRRYWRGPVLRWFDGRRWSNPEQHIPLPYGIDNNENKALLHYIVTLEPQNKYWMFVLGLPFQYPTDSYINQDLQLVSKHRLEKVYRYDINSLIDYQFDGIQEFDLQPYLEIPRGMAPRTRTLARELRQRAQNDEDVVKMALEYIANNPFYYTRRPPLLFDDPVDEFLFETRRGFCGHYASAFTILMRAANIPARVVTGYQGGEMNPLDDYMIIRQSDAHAWTEIWLAKQGWTRIDPTSLIPADRIENTEDLVRRQPLIKTPFADLDWFIKSWRQTQFAWDALNHRWTQWVIGYNDARQRSVFSTMGLPNITWRGLSVLLFFFLTVTVLSIAFLIFRRSMIRRDPILKTYERFCRKLSKKGLSRHPSEGPHAFACRIIQSYPQWTHTVSSITQLYIAMRYSPSAQLFSLQDLKTAVRKFKPR